MLSAERRQSILPHASLAILLFAGLASVWHPMLPEPLITYPKDLVVPLAAKLGDFLNWLAREAAIGPVKISAITRGARRIVDLPMNGLNVLLTTGWRSGYGEHVVTIVPPLGWFSVLGLCGLLGWKLAGPRLGLLI